MRPDVERLLYENGYPLHLADVLPAQSLETALATDTLEKLVERATPEFLALWGCACPQHALDGRLCPDPYGPPLPDGRR